MSDQLIASIEELLTSREAAVHKEAEDKSLLRPILRDPRGVLRIPLFQWAATNFQNAYVLKAYTLTPPDICSDGVRRSPYEYTEFCLGIPIPEFILRLQARVTGMTLSYSFIGPTFHLHVTR